MRAFFASFSLLLLLCSSSSRLTQAGPTATIQTRLTSTKLPSSSIFTLTTNSSETSSQPKTTDTTFNHSSKTRTTMTSSEVTTVQPNNSSNHVFVPRMCEVISFDNSSQKEREQGDVLINWLSSNPVLISQENKPIDLECQFCLRKSVPFSQIRWYKDNKPIDANSEMVSGSTLHISSPNNNINEGLYRCTVVTANNETTSLTTTLIVNKDPRISMIPSIWVRNETHSQNTLISWLVRGHGIFDSVKVIVKVRQIQSSIWEYRRYYVQYLSGSTELQDLIPSTEYIVNISSLNENGVKEECRCVSFWSNTWNSTEEHAYGILSLSISNRRSLGLVFGVLGLLFTLFAIYCCVVHPNCELRSHHGYAPPGDQGNDGVINPNTTNCSMNNYYKHSSNLHASDSQQQILKL